MDTSYWTKLNREIKFSHTKKQYYGKYLCRLAMYMPGGRACHAKDIEQALDSRKDLIREYPNWRAALRLEEASVRQISALSYLVSNNPKIKVRIEEPMVQIYAETIEDLKEVAEAFPPHLQHRFIEVGCPANEAATALLKQGKILRNTAQDYRYKILLKDGAYNPETKRRVLDYLDGLGDTVRITPASRTMLTRPYNWMWSVYFYSNDNGITTFLNLVAPGIISNIHEIEQVPQ